MIGACDLLVDADNGTPFEEYAKDLRHRTLARH